MVRPEDTATFVPPWWVGEMIMRGRDAAPVPADRGWTRLLDAGGGPQLSDLKDAGVEVTMPDAYEGGKLGYFTAGMEGDRRAMRIAAALAASDTPPDLILTEILMPDVVQHVAGTGTPAATGSLATADALVAVLLDDLERAGRRGDVNIMVVSDHGHGPVTRALHPERILPGVTHASEGGTLFVHLPDGGLGDVRERLAAHDVTPLEGDIIPADVAHVHAFAAPPGTAFEPAADDAPAKVTWSAPRYVSSHGFQAGSPRDDRACVLAGPNVLANTVEEAPASAVEATLAALLGLPAYGAGPSLISL
jgi:predicted AlkP superfamily pyrophosphatase or phosphodiesterase